MYGDTKFSNILLDAVVFEPIRFMLSLRARGTPARSGKSSPLAIFSSTFFAVSSAISSVKELKAPSFSSIALIRSKEALVSSTAEISLFFSAFDCSIALFFNSSSITSPLIILGLLIRLYQKQKECAYKYIYYPRPQITLAIY